VEKKMKKLIITMVLIVALVMIPAPQAQSVAVMVVIGVIGICLDVLSVIGWVTDKTDDKLHDESATLSSQLLDEVGDVAFYTVKVSAAVDDFPVIVYSRKVKATLYLGSNNASGSKETGGFKSAKTVSFKFKVEGVKTGLENVYVKVQMFKNTLSGTWVETDSWTSATEYFDIKHAYTLKDVEVSPGTLNVRHFEIFTTKLKADVKTPKAGSYTGENVQNEFGPTAVAGASGTGSYTITLNTFSSKHADMPCGICIGDDFPVLDLITGTDITIAGGAKEFNFDHTPPHLLPQTFRLSPFSAKFTIPKGNFDTTRSSDYVYKPTKGYVTMTCNGGKIWEGESDVEPVDPNDLVGNWAGFDFNIDTTINFVHDPNTYSIIDQYGGATVEEGTWTWASPLTLTPDFPTGALPRTYLVLSNSPEKLILYGGKDQEGSEVQNLAAGTIVPEGSIEGEIMGLDPALFPHTFVAAFSADGYDTPSDAYANTPVSIGQVGPTGQYVLDRLNEGNYLIAAYKLDVPVLSIPMPPDYAARYAMETYAVGGFDTPDSVTVPFVGPGYSYFELEPAYQVLPDVTFLVSTYGADAEILSIELTGDNHVVINCTGGLANIQMWTENEEWRDMIGDLSGTPPSWSWTSFEAMSEDMAWFRLKN
jgi:hypothetical protein